MIAKIRESKENKTYGREYQTSYTHDSKKGYTSREEIYPESDVGPFFESTIDKRCEQDEPTKSFTDIKFIAKPITSNPELFKYVYTLRIIHHKDARNCHESDEDGRNPEGDFHLFWYSDHKKENKEIKN